MSMVGFPLLLIPLAIYNIIVFLMPSVSLGETLVTLPLVSGAGWPITLGDILLTLAILLLLLEVIKGARPGAKYLTDHLLSFIICGAAIAEFLLWPRFASSTFFLLTLLALVDFLSGIALRARRGAPAVAAGRGRAPVATKSDSEARRERDTELAQQGSVASRGEAGEHDEAASARSPNDIAPRTSDVTSPALHGDQGTPRPPETPR